MADNILQTYFGIARPWSFEEIDINQSVAQTNSKECSEASDSGTTGTAGGSNTTGGTSTTGGSSTTGGTSTTGGSSSSGGDEAPTDDVLCFTGDALVEMADSSFKKIRDVRLGDYVATGTGLGDGLVTEALVHVVAKIVPVAVVKTSQGDLVGTPEHPVFYMGEWIEVGEMPSETVSLQRRFVDAFYNLEVDGDVMHESSSHSYIVNGVVASGLGDREELNLRFPRQHFWKLAAIAAEQ